MLFPKAPRRWARGTVFVPISAVALLASPAMAASIVVNQGQTVSDVTLDATHDALVNSGSILRTGAAAAVFGMAPVVSITNNAGALIDGGSEDGIQLNNAAGRITNAGTIVGAKFGINVGAVDVFLNTGTVTGGADNAVYIGGNVQSFTNAAGGILRSIGTWTVDISFDVDTFINAGTIVSDANIGVALYGGVGNFINSGTIRAPLKAIHFAGGTTARTLTIVTGSKIYGVVDFGGVIAGDTLDFSGFAGSTLLSVPGLDAVTPGSRHYVWDQANQQIAIFDLDDAGASAASISDNRLDLVNAVNAVIDSQFAALGFSGMSGDQVLNYSAGRPQSAAEAVLSKLDTGSATKVWASAIAGGSRDDLPIATTKAFGALVAGAHAQLAEGAELGLTGAYALSGAATASGQLSTQTALAGLYGRSDFGTFSLDYSLLAGYDANTSRREVAALGASETAIASFSSWFIAPSLGVELPVLSGEAGNLAVTASATYLGGGVSSYAETGSSMNLAVGSQTIAVFDGRFGILARVAEGDVRLAGRAGLFTQANFGGANVPVSVLGQTISVSAPGTSGYGLYAGADLEAALGENLDLTIGADGSIRSDGLLAGSLKATLAGTF
jgi:hypothetical protein